jgi:hypothetical protein
LVDLPVLGFPLYKLNVNRVVVRYMAAGHVYADPAWLSDERLREKTCGRSGSWISICINPVCDRRARSGRNMRTVSGSGATSGDPDADGLWESDAATIARRDGSARDD